MNYIIIDVVVWLSGIRFKEERGVEMELEIIVDPRSAVSKKAEFNFTLDMIKRVKIARNSIFLFRTVCVVDILITIKLVFGKSIGIWVFFRDVSIFTISFIWLPLFVLYLTHIIRQIRKIKHHDLFKYKFTDESIISEHGNLTVTVPYENVCEFIIEDSFIALYFQILPKVPSKKIKKIRSVFPSADLTSEQKNMLASKLSGHKQI